MSEVLVLVDSLVDGKVAKPTLELLTIARRLGEPSAVVFGDADCTSWASTSAVGATRSVSNTPLTLPTNSLV
jgi:electron transfer flavoprotein alpha subunit